ncbi:MAG: 50S ribosomal protein L9 [Candidatus Coatesbacteria bacterium]|nr:MAG: 50S ribosomal protein L9 [Candidatus Coatesbacteria bacterium]
MEVLLIKEHEKLGDRGTLVNVARGYARNFLIPRGLAVPATEKNRTAFARQEEIRKKKAERLTTEASAFAEKLIGVSYTFEKPVSEKNELYGSVTQAEIAERLKADGFEVDRKQVVLEEPINKLGLFRVKIELAEGVAPEIKIWVVRERAEETTEAPAADSGEPDLADRTESPGEE